MVEYLIQESDMISIADAIREKTGKSDRINFGDMVSEISGISTGVELNVEVVGNPQPQNPKENTIWVDTNKINNYYFSATQPENMADYDVWISTGASSTVAFNALKKNGIQVYPISAKQYISGALVDKNAKSYQGGKWVEWIVYLYYNGNQYEDITGGYVGKAWRFNSHYSTSEVVTPTVNNTDNYLSISVPAPGTDNYRGGVAIIQNDVDLSNYSKMKVTFHEKPTFMKDMVITLGVGDRNSTYYSVVGNGIVAVNNLDDAFNGTEAELSLDGVNITCAVYIGIKTGNTTSAATIKIAKIELI